mgnify:CR=1 FL=1
MPVQTVNALVKRLIELGTDYDVRQAEPDREDGPDTVTYRASEGDRDQTLDGFSGLEFWRYIVSVRGRDPDTSETASRSIQDELDGLAVNYQVDNFIVQAASTGSITDEDRQAIVGDQFDYQYSFTLTLAIGRAS